jgi:hypothetical protein
LFLPPSDALAVTPALPVAFSFALCGRPVTLLRFPPRPSPRRSPAGFAAITLARLPWTKSLFASLQQTTAGARTARRALPPAGFLAFSRACKILVRAHGSAAPGKLMPWRGLASSPRGAAGPVQRELKTLSQIPVVFFSRLRRAIRLLSDSVGAMVEVCCQGMRVKANASN